MGDFASAPVLPTGRPALDFPPNTIPSVIRAIIALASELFVGRPRTRKNSLRSPSTSRRLSASIWSESFVGVAAGAASFTTFSLVVPSCFGAGFFDFGAGCLLGLLMVILGCAVGHSPAALAHTRSVPREHPLRFDDAVTRVSGARWGVGASRSRSRGGAPAKRRDRRGRPLLTGAPPRPP